MSTWILDDTQLDVMARHIPAAEVAQWNQGGFADRLFVARATAEAASGLRHALLATPSLATFEIMMDSPAADVLYRHFRQPGGETKNLAERQAIAWALTERPDAIFVVVDKRATVEALAELGRMRVAHAYDLWLALLDEGLITPQQCQILCESTRRSDQTARIPLRCLARWSAPP